MIVLEVELQQATIVPGSIKTMNLQSGMDQSGLLRLQRIWVDQAMTLISAAPRHLSFGRDETLESPQLCNTTEDGEEVRKFKADLLAFVICCSYYCECVEWSQRIL